MTNTEWKKGYEEGFAAGWKAAKENKDMNYKNYPPVYYGGYKPGEVGTYSFATMADNFSINAMNTHGNDTITTIRNLNDHTRIV